MKTPIPSIPRRRFLQTTGTLATLLALRQAPTVLRAAEGTGRVRVAVLGLGRGMDHISAYLQIPTAEIAAVCDVDSRRLAKGVKAVETGSGNAPRAVGDFRRILDDKSIDAVSIALPNFWHAPMTLLACAAGKHVYVEKPGSHNAHEAGLMAVPPHRLDRVTADNWTKLKVGYAHHPRRDVNNKGRFHGKSQWSTT